MTDPTWLTDGTPVVVYFPRPKPELSEAWLVTSLRLTATTIVVWTELGEDRFGRFDLCMRVPGVAAGPYRPVLVPADDPRAVAAADRTAVMRAANRLVREISRHRPNRTTPTAELLVDVEAIRDAAAMACDDIAALIARQPS